MVEKFDSSFWVSILVLAVLAVVAGAIIMIWRARAMSGGGEGGSHELLSESLRRMHAEGKLSDEEYKAARRKLVERSLERKAREATDEDAPAGGEAGSVLPGSDGSSAQSDGNRPGSDPPH